MAPGTPSSALNSDLCGNSLILAIIGSDQSFVSISLLETGRSIPVSERTQSNPTRVPIGNGVPATEGC